MKDLLEPDESIINPFYMRQLLEYGIKLGVSQNGEIDPDSLLREAEVYTFSHLSLVIVVFTFFIAPCGRTKRHQLKHQNLPLSLILFSLASLKIVLSYLCNRRDLFDFL